MYCAFILAAVLLLRAQVTMAAQYSLETRTAANAPTTTKAPSTIPAPPRPGIVNCIRTVIQGTLKKYDCTEALTKVDKLFGQMVDGFQEDVQALKNVLAEPLEKCVHFWACIRALLGIPKQLIAIASTVIKRILQVAVDFFGLVHTSMKCVGVVSEFPSMFRGVLKCI